MALFEQEEKLTADKLLSIACAMNWSVIICVWLKSVPAQEIKVE